MIQKNNNDTFRTIKMIILPDDLPTGEKANAHATTIRAITNLNIFCLYFIIYFTKSIYR